MSRYLLIAYGCEISRENSSNRMSCVMDEESSSIVDLASSIAGKHGEEPPSEAFKLLSSFLFSAILPRPAGIPDRSRMIRLDMRSLAQPMRMDGIDLAASAAASTRRNSSSESTLSRLFSGEGFFTPIIGETSSRSLCTHQLKKWLSAEWVRFAVVANP